MKRSPTGPTPAIHPIGIMFRACWRGAIEAGHRESAWTFGSLRSFSLQGKVSRADHRELLRRLALQDKSCVKSMLAMGVNGLQASGLDPKVGALARLGALVAVGASTVSFQSNIDAALAAGATNDEIVAILIAVAPITGVARVTAASPKIAFSIGYDLDAAFEEFNDEPS